MAALKPGTANVFYLPMANLRLRRTQISMRDLIEQCVASTSALFLQCNQRLLVSVEPEPMEMDADAARLTQVLYSLLANASRHTARGARIRISAQREQDDAVVTVRDRGVGIAVAELESIFALFSDDLVSSVEADGVHGIGLYLSRVFAEAHGGSLTAASAGHGLGSTFTLRMPCLAFSASSSSSLQPWWPSSRSVSFLTTA